MIDPIEEFFKRHRTEHLIQYELRPVKTCLWIWKGNCRSAAVLGNHEVYQCLFRYMASTIPLLPKPKHIPFYCECKCTAWFCVRPGSKTDFVMARHMCRAMKKSFEHVQKKHTQISFMVTAKLINAFVFTTKIEKSLFVLNPE